MMKDMGRFDRTARWGVTAVTSLTPFVIVGGLLYAAFFVKAAASISAVQPPAIERRDVFLGVAKPGDATVWAAGNNGKIVRSGDAGAHWVAQSVPVIENLEGIAAWDGDKAVAVGGGGMVLFTEDAGKTWKEASAPKSQVANKLLNVRTYPNGEAWAVGEMGAVLKTVDFGKTWERMLPEKDQAWNDVSFSGKHGLLVGEFGQILKTEDGGKTWQAADGGIKSSLMSVFLRDDGNAVAVGLAGAILVSSDGGSHWQAADRLTREHLNNVIWDGQRWVAVGDKGVIVFGEAATGEGALAGGAETTWKVSRVSEGNLGWNTQIVAMKSADKAPSYLLAGAGLSRLANGKLTVFGRDNN